ncbi:hypothetical protein ACLOJK_006272 [Asimina triloba]
MDRSKSRINRTELRCVLAIISLDRKGGMDCDEVNQAENASLSQPEEAHASKSRGKEHIPLGIHPPLIFAKRMSSPSSSPVPSLGCIGHIAPTAGNNPGTPLPPSPPPPPPPSVHFFVVYETPSLWAAMITPNSFIDLTTIIFLIILFVFSVFSISFIFHFRVKTLRHASPYLRDFNSLWPARILLVSFALLWSLAEILRLCPFPSCCKAYLVASEGLFQPSFFILLLFLVSASLNGKSNHDNTLIKALTVLSVSVLPVCILQVFVIFFSHHFSPFSTFPEPFHRTSVLMRGRRDGLVVCAYPAFSTVVLGGFGVGYVACFVAVCWRAGSLVINKTLRLRICGLAVSVALAVPAQVMCLALSAMWRPGDAVFEMLSLVAFLSVLSCAVVGEGILVIRPMADALVVEAAAASSREPKTRVNC